ncbi:MAG TPA: hypothetical protein VGK59_03180 [Ohtaekwangia sp.]
MKGSLLLFCLLSVFMAEAQIKRISFRAAANYPVIPTVKTSGEFVSLSLVPGYVSQPTAITLKERYESHMGFDLGGTLDYAVAPRFFISTGLNLAYLRFKKIVTIDGISGNDGLQMHDGNGSVTILPVGEPFGNIIDRDLNGNVTPPTQPFSMGPSEDKGNTTTLYLQVPVLIGTTFFHDKLIVRGGVSLSYLAGAAQYLDQYSYSTGTIESYKEKSRDGYSSFLVAGTIVTTYMITRTWGIDLSVNKFLTPIYDTNQSGEKAKYTTLTLGVNYSINR